MNKIIKRIQKEFKAPLVRQNNYSPFQNYYLFSDPRGGSTWLMEILQSITGTPVIWEPLNLKIKNNPFRKLGFGYRQHIPEDIDWDEAKVLFDELFSGNVLAKNLLNSKSYSEVKNSERLLFKICRGNALLPWLTSNFSFNFKPIYLIRHPFAVVSSQMRHGAWNHAIKQFQIPETPFNDNYKKHRSFLKTIETKEEKLVAEWCLSNSQALNNPNNNKKWLTINYEEFVLNPQKTIHRILKDWEIQCDLSEINFRKNSKTTKGDSPIAVKERIAHWQTKLTDDQIKRMSDVLDYFQIAVYSKNNPFPEKVFNYE